ncbi:MAG TPA: arsenate reductase family protein [Acidimicrobiales bacterium]
MELWHNPRCSKSRAAKAILDERGVGYSERRYLDDPPTADELDAVLTALGKEPWDIARTDEAIARELGLRDWPHDRDRWIAALVEHPVLIQRPILVADDGRAALGRPPEDVEALL